MRGQGAHVRALVFLNLQRLWLRGSIRARRFVDVQLLLLFHQVVEGFLLVRRQFLAKFFLHVIVFVMNIRGDLVPKIADAALRIFNDFLDAGVLLGREVEVLLDATHEFDFAQLLKGKRRLRGTGGCARGVLHGGRLGAFRQSAGDVAGDKSGAENHQHGEYCFPGVHRA